MPTRGTSAVRARSLTLERCGGAHVQVVYPLHARCRGCAQITTFQAQTKSAFAGHCVNRSVCLQRNNLWQTCAKRQYCQRPQQKTGAKRHSGCVAQRLHSPESTYMDWCVGHARTQKWTHFLSWLPNQHPRLYHDQDIAQNQGSHGPSNDMLR